jgi:S-(hydroxymethyl)glutathione dehydrogenase/alcohol dehydrogenase
MEKLKLAKILGADFVINANESDIKEKVMDITNGGVSYCIDSGGLTSTIELGFSILNKHKGELIFASHPPDGELIRLSPHELISGKKISGSWGGGCRPDIDVPEIYELLKKSNQLYDNNLMKKYKLGNINDAIEDMRLGRVFRPLIVMDH